MTSLRMGGFDPSSGVPNARSAMFHFLFTWGLKWQIENGMCFITLCQKIKEIIAKSWQQLEATFFLGLLYVVKLGYGGFKETNVTHHPTTSSPPYLHRPIGYMSIFENLKKACLYVLK